MDRQTLYRKIEQDLREKIQTDYYRVGDVLPTELELAKEYSVSRPTINKALSVLVEDGLLSRKKKAGTKVISRKISSNFISLIESYNEDIENNKYFPKTKVINFQKVNADSDLASIMNVAEGELLFKLVRLRFAGVEPTVYVTTYVPEKFVPKLWDYDFSATSLYKTLSLLNHKIVKVNRKLEVSLSSETLSSLLNINVNDPIFYFTTFGYDVSENLIEYSIANYRGDLNSFKISISQ